MEPLRVRVVWQENAGQAAALATGFHESRMPVVALLDADDEWQQGRLDAALGMMRRDPTLDGVFGYAQEVACEKTASGAAHVLSYVGEPQIARLFSSLVIWADAFEKIGMPALGLGMGTTLEWFDRASTLGKLGVLEARPYFRHLHEHNYTRTHQGDMHEYHRAVKLILDRRRAAQG